MRCRRHKQITTGVTNTQRASLRLIKVTSSGKFGKCIYSEPKVLFVCVCVYMHTERHFKAEPKLLKLEICRRTDNEWGKQVETTVRQS